MQIPELTRREVERKLSQLCERHGRRAAGRARLSYRFRGSSVTVFVERAGAPAERSAVAQFRLNPESRLWQLYCADRNRRWHRYTEVPPTRIFEALVKELEEDPSGIFWG